MIILWLLWNYFTNAYAWTDRFSGVCRKIHLHLVINNHATDIALSTAVGSENLCQTAQLLSYQQFVVVFNVAEALAIFFVVVGGSHLDSQTKAIFGGQSKTAIV